MSRVPHARTALTSAVLAALAHWLLAAHRPAAPPDPTSALAVPLLAYSVAGRAWDALTTSLPVGQDVAAGAWLVLVLSAAVATSWLKRLGVPSAIAVAFGVGVTFLRTPWSSHAAGRDALLLLGGLLIVRALTTPPSTPSRTSVRAVGALVLVLVTYHPSLAWLLGPLCLYLPGLSRHERSLWAGLTTASALTTVVIHSALARNADACLAGAGLTEWLMAAMLPGRVPATSPWTSVAQATTAFLANTHVFGLVAATWGLCLIGNRVRGLRGLTFVSVPTLLAAATVGAITTETFVWLGLVIWLPWYAFAGHALWNHAEGRWRLPGRIAVLALAVLLPVGRHAVTVPSAMASDTPHVRAHAEAAADGAWHVVGDVPDARLARAARHTLVPLDAPLITACLASGRRVVASGPVVQALRAGGAELVNLPVVVPLSSLLEDVRPGAVVAFGATSAAVRWLRPSDTDALGRLGLSGNDIRTRGAQALVVSVPASGDRSTGRPVHAVQTDVVTEVAGRTLWNALRVTTSQEGVVVDTLSPGPAPLVRGHSAAIAIFNRDETPVVRGTASAEPGLPFTVFSPQTDLTWVRVVAWPSASAAGSGVRKALPPLLPVSGPALVEDETPRTVPVYLGDGWHDAEPAGRSSFRWSARSDATATVRLDRPSALRVTADAAPAQTSDWPNRLRLLVNGRPVGEPLEGAMTIDVPAAATRAGVNTLTFATDVVVPAGVVPGEPRRLGAVVRHLRVERW